MTHQKMITVSDASVLLGVSERQVRRYCTEGKLDAIRDGKAYSIVYASVVSLLNQNEGSGQNDENDTDVITDTPDDLEQTVPSSDRISSDTSDRAESADIEGEIPSDIYNLASDIVSASNALKSASDKVLRRLWFEHKRNEALEQDLADALAKLRLPAPMKSE